MESVPSTSSQPDNLASQLSNDLLAYKQIIPTLYSVFTWQKQYYPVILAAAVSVVYLLIWALDASLLTTVSLFGALVAVTEYLLPIIISNFFDSSKWNEDSEEKYQTVCANLAFYWSAAASHWAHWSQLRQSKSKTYYLSVLGLLLVLAWIGNTFNSLLLAYIVTLKLVLLPGLKHHGLIKKALDSLVKVIKGAISKEKKN